MIKYLTPIALVLLTATGVANANAVKTSGQAITACKSHIKENVQGVTSAKMNGVRTVREHHNISFAIRDESGRYRTVCSVNRKDGTIVLNN